MRPSLSAATLSRRFVLALATTLTLCASLGAFPTLAATAKQP